jgi:hypothetical protein
MNLYEEWMLGSSLRTVSGVKYKIENMKEPMLRRILKGESITEKEEGYLSALEDVSQILQEYHDEIIQQDTDIVG